MAISKQDLVDRYRDIYARKMRDLPLCNPALEVEAVGFRTLDEHRLGVLVTPWFINLILLPDNETWDNSPDGTIESLPLPSERCEFTVCQDDILGTYLSAVLFRSVADFVDQDTAVAVARETLRLLFTPAIDTVRGAGSARAISRRRLITGLGAS